MNTATMKAIAHPNYDDSEIIAKDTVVDSPDEAIVFFSSEEEQAAVEFVDEAIRSQGAMARSLWHLYKLHSGDKYSREWGSFHKLCEKLHKEHNFPGPSRCYELVWIYEEQRKLESIEGLDVPVSKLNNSMLLQLRRITELDLKREVLERAYYDLGQTSFTARSFEEAIEDTVKKYPERQVVKKVKARKRTTSKTSISTKDWQELQQQVVSQGQVLNELKEEIDRARNEKDVVESQLIEVSSRKQQLEVECDRLKRENQSLKEMLSFAETKQSKKIEASIDVVKTEELSSSSDNSNPIVEPVVNNKDDVEPEATASFLSPENGLKNSPDLEPSESDNRSVEEGVDSHAAEEIEADIKQLAECKIQQGIPLVLDRELIFDAESLQEKESALKVDGLPIFCKADELVQVLEELEPINGREVSAISYLKEKIGDRIRCYRRDGLFYWRIEDGESEWGSATALHKAISHRLNLDSYQYQSELNKYLAELDNF